MFWLLFSLGISARQCNPVYQFDIHGEVMKVRTNEAGWAYASTSFGDFGHTVNVRAWEDIDGVEPAEELEIYMNYGHGCPDSNSTKIEGSKVFLESSTQYAIFGFQASKQTNITIAIASTVRPIHPNSAQACIYGFFIFFTFNFVLTGFLQFFYFRGAMDPNEYRLND